MRINQIYLNLQYLKIFLAMWRRPIVSAALSCGLLLSGLVSNQTTDATSSVAAISTGNTTSTIEFSSAVHMVSSISWSLHQLSTIPGLPLPTNISAFPKYEIVGILALALPPFQAGVSFGPVNSMIADISALTNVFSPGSLVVRRQSTPKVMIVSS